MIIINFFNDEFIKIGNKFVFKIGIPALLFINVYNISNFDNINLKVALYSVLSVVVLLLLGILLSHIFIKDNQKRGVIIQCAFRSNYYIIGIPLALALGGSSSVEVASVLSAFLIPFYNIFSVIVLQIYCNSTKIDYKSILLNIIKNPLIIGVVLGLIILAIRPFIPLDSDNNLVFTLESSNYTKFIFSCVKDVAVIASPLALILLGSDFKFSSASELKKEISLGVSLRLIISPIVVLGIAILIFKTNNFINIEANDFPALIAIASSPVAVSSAVMAINMNGHKELATQLVVWTTIFSAIVLFFTIITLSYFGIF